MSDNTELWDELSELRRELKALKASVARLEQTDLTAFLWRQHTHEIGRCDLCHEPHELAVVGNGGPKVVGGDGDGLRGLCLSCFIRGHERQAVAR